MDAGHVRHYALVPASDPELVRAWSRVSFGQQHAHGIQEVPDVPWPDGVRLAEARDVDALLELDPLLPDHQAQTPVFARGFPSESPEALRAEILEDLAKPEIGDLVAERDGVVVGAFQLSPAELSSMHSGLARPDGAALLNWAATRPAARGRGAGVALDAGGVRLGPGARARRHRDRLARDEPARVPLLAGARLSRDVPASLPAHSVVPRIPILSDSRLAVVNAPDDAVVLRPAPPSESIADVGSAVRDALRFPLSGSPLEALTKPGGTVTLVVEPPELPLPGAPDDPRRDALAAAIDELERLGVRSQDQTILVAGGLNRRAGQRELEDLVAPEHARRFHGRVEVHDVEAR